MVITADTPRIVRAAQKLIDRSIQRLTAEIPKCLVDARDGGPNHWPRAVEAVHIHGLPVMLDLHRIFADDKVSKVLDAGHSGLRFALESALSPANQALVGLELHENIRSIRIRG